MSDRPSPLPDDLLDLLDAERELSPTPVEVRERMFARLAPLIVPTGGGADGDGGAGGGGAGGSSAPDAAAGGGTSGGGPNIPDAGALGSAASAAAATWGSKIITVVLSASLGAVGGAATYAALVSPPAQQVVNVTPVAPAVEVTPPVAETTPPVTTPIDPTQGATRPARPPKPVAKPSPSDLRAERLLVETASAALFRGDHASALATLRSHVAKYPRGALVEEREVLMIQALSASGDKDAAKRRAQAFRRDFPGSLQLGAVNKAAE